MAIKYLLEGSITHALNTIIKCTLKAALYLWQLDYNQRVVNLYTHQHKGCKLQGAASCNVASQLISSKCCVYDVWECEPSLCGAALHKATSRSQLLRSSRCRRVRLSPPPACKDALWSALQTKLNSLGSQPLSGPLNTAVLLREIFIQWYFKQFIWQDCRNTCTPFSLTLLQCLHQCVRVS